MVRRHHDVMTLLPRDARCRLERRQAACATILVRHGQHQRINRYVLAERHIVELPPGLAAEPKRHGYHVAPAALAAALL